MRRRGVPGNLLHETVRPITARTTGSRYLDSSFSDAATRMRRFSKWVSVLAVMAACSSALARDAAGDPGEYLTQLRSDHFQKLDVALTALQRRYERGSIDEVELRDAFNTLV